MAEKLYTHMRETKLRATPNPNGEVVALVPKGTEVEVFEERDGYYGIRAYPADSGQVSGYVFKSLIGPIERSKEDKATDLVRHLPPCRECGENAWVFLPYQRGSVSPYLVAGFFNYVEVQARVCLSCGVVVPCLDPQQIAVLREKHNQ